MSQIYLQSKNILSVHKLHVHAYDIGVRAEHGLSTQYASSIISLKASKDANSIVFIIINVKHYLRCFHYS